MHEDRSPIPELPPDAVVIDLGDSDQKRLPADVFDEENNLDVGQKHGRFGGGGGRSEPFFRKDPRWESFMPQSHLRLRKTVRHKTFESGVSECGILKRSAVRDGKVRDKKGRDDL